MTPPDVWTSEPPSVAGYYYYRRDGDEPFVLRIVPTADGVTRELFVLPPWSWADAIEGCGAQRSVEPIKSAERAAALEECAAALGCILARINDRGAQLEGYAALARLEACR